MSTTTPSASSSSSSSSSSRSTSRPAQQSSSSSTLTGQTETSETPFPALLPVDPSANPSMLTQWSGEDAQRLGIAQLLGKVPGTSYSSAPQPFRPQTTSPQPFQSTSSAVSPVPTLSVKPSDVTSTSFQSPSPVPSASSLQLGNAKPAPVVAGMGTLPMNLAPTQTADSSSASDSVRAIPTNKNNPAFLNKLRSMVDDTNTNELICWSPDGASFFVPNHVRFGDEVLPRFFKHSNFSSFVRQLNMYGFHKVPHLQQGALKHDLPQESELWEFSNPHFHRDHPEWLSKVQRKKGNKDEKDSNGKQSQRENSSTAVGQELMQAGALMRTDFGAATGGENNNEGALQLASVLNALNNIKNAQSNIITDLHHLRNSHQNLWQAELESRQRQNRTSDTVNKILRFLAGVFGNQEEDDPTPVAGKKGSGKGRGGGAGRRVGVRPPRKGRLMIEDSKSNADVHANVVRGLEELELPADNNLEEMAEDMPSYMRFQEASSRPDSPKTNAHSPATGSRFTTIGSPPNMSADFANLASEAPMTPGGSRRLSSHASNQVLNALASGEGNAWLASLFGASLAKQGSFKGANPSSGGGLKLDPQVVAALQQALVGSNGSESDYLNSGSATGAGDSSDFASRFSYPNAKSQGSGTSDSHGSSSNRGSAPTPGMGQGLGLDADALARLAGISQALVQSPARQPFPSNNSAYFDSSASPSKATASTAMSDDANRQQLALSLARTSRDMQNTSSDVATVQNSINALIEGLQTNLAQNQPAASTVQQPTIPQPDWQSQVNNVNPAAPSLPQFAGHVGQPPAFPAAQGSGADTTSNPSGPGANGIDSDFDVDSFLSQFVDTSQAPGGGVTSPGGAFADSGSGLGLGLGEGESPSFAFSPTTTASFLQDAGVSEPLASNAASQTEPTIHSIDSSTANTPAPSSPTATPTSIADQPATWNMTLPKPSKKRKPSSSSLDPVASSPSSIPSAHHKPTSKVNEASATPHDVEMVESRPPPPKKHVTNPSRK